MTAFVAQTSSALHSQGKLLTVAVPPKERHVAVGWSGAYDYAALGAAADLVTVMAYAYRGAFSGPGSIAPYNWVDRVLAFATQQIEPDKVLLGLAVYGYDWNVTAGGTRSLGNTQAAALAARYATPIDFDPVDPVRHIQLRRSGGRRATAARRLAAGDHDVTVRTPPPCDTPSPPAATPRLLHRKCPTARRNRTRSGSRMPPAPRRASSWRTPTACAASPRGAWVWRIPACGTRWRVPSAN